jgi:hypothetical protein
VDEDEPEVLIEQSRLPPSVDSFLGPDFWDTDHTLKYYAYIQAGQQKELSNDKILQFSRVNGQDVPNVLQTDIHQESALRYDGASRLFVARLLRNEPNDAIALHEIVAQLPPLLGVYCTLLDPEGERDVMEHAGDNVKLQNLVRYTMDYEQGRPVQVCTSLLITLY